MKFNKLNVEELTVGAVYGLTFFPTFGIKTLALIPALSVLWALGGAGSKLWRRIGVASLPPIMALLSGAGYVVLLSVPAIYGVLSIGYGMPSMYPPDEGSNLGRFFLGIFEGDRVVANLATRVFIYLLLALASMPVYFS